MHNKAHLEQSFCLQLQVGLQTCYGRAIVESGTINVEAPGHAFMKPSKTPSWQATCDIYRANEVACVQGPMSQCYVHHLVQGGQLGQQRHSPYRHIKHRQCQLMMRASQLSMLLRTFQIGPQLSLTPTSVFTNLQTSSTARSWDFRGNRAPNVWTLHNINV